jgi:hypothetical protein
MDDYSINSLGESKNEWCARLVNILTPELIQGLKSIFEEAWKLCRANDEEEKYLLIFQTFLSRIPKWNATIIQDEVTRIIEKTGCTYLEELLTCVHVIHLKILTCVRVGQKQKKIDIDVPSLTIFIHKTYINIARKVYTNSYLFENNIAPLQIQKHNRELELIIKECILNTIRESIPVDSLLRAYMDETEEQDVEIKEVEEKIPIVKPAKDLKASGGGGGGGKVLPNQEPIMAELVLAGGGHGGTQAQANDRITFSDVDKSIDIKGNEQEIIVPKTEEHLNAIERIREENNKLFSNADNEDDDDNEEEEETLRIGDDISLDFTDVNDITKPLVMNSQPPILDDIVVLT